MVALLCVQYYEGDIFCVIPPCYPVQLPSAPMPGDLRQFQQFDVRLSILAEATIDILFSKVC